MDKETLSASSGDCLVVVGGLWHSQGLRFVTLALTVQASTKVPQHTPPISNHISFFMNTEVYVTFQNDLGTEIAHLLRAEFPPQPVTSASGEPMFFSDFGPIHAPHAALHYSFLAFGGWRCSGSELKIQTPRAGKKQHSRLI